jgi:WS/DGAT/MGAT family acyltransferase
MGWLEWREEMAKKPVSSVDTAWLRMEDPTNLMMITGVMVFGAPMDYERLKLTVEERLLQFDRFRQRVVVTTTGRYCWEDDPDFDLSYHLPRAKLPAPGDQATLQELTSLLASTQLDHNKPLWQVHLIEEYGDGCALICRLHHCIGDGLALVHVLLSLTDAEPDAPWPVFLPTGKHRSRRRRLDTILQPPRAMLKSTCRLTGALTEQCQEIRADPSRAADLVRTGGRASYALGRLAAYWPDPKTIFKGSLSVGKQTAWSAPIPIGDIKAVGKDLGGTINDVLLTAMSGALRRYLQSRNQKVDHLNFRAVVPVNLRKPGKEEELGNKFGLVFLSLPIGIADPQQRLQELKRRMDALKGSLEAPVAFGILTTIGASPEPIQELVVKFFGSKGTGVMTNVVGPQEELYLAGAPLESLMFWVPQSGRLGLGVSILSYNDQVWMGVITDRGLVPDPEKIIGGFEAEFTALRDVARQTQEISDLAEAAAQLEETLEKLDMMSPEDVRQDKKAASSAPGRCQALTKAGKPCKNPPLAGSEFCYVHQEQ